MRRRRVIIPAVLLGLPLFLGISFFLARGLTANNMERSLVASALQEQARGANIQILSYQPSMQFSLKGKAGTGRVAWRVNQGKPTVQCASVSRTGVFHGAVVTLHSLSRPLKPNLSCPKND